MTSCPEKQVQVGMGRVLIKLLHQVQSRPSVQECGAAHAWGRCPDCAPQATRSVRPPGSSLSLTSLPPSADQALSALLSLCPLSALLSLCPRQCCLCLRRDTPSPVRVLPSPPSHTFRPACAMSHTRPFGLLPLSPSLLYLFSLSAPPPCQPMQSFDSWVLLSSSVQPSCLPSLSPADCPVPGPDLEINPTLESLCLSMTEHALGGEHFLFP